MRARNHAKLSLSCAVCDPKPTRKPAIVSSRSATRKYSAESKKLRSLAASSGRIAGPAALFGARTESISCSRTSRTTIDIEDSELSGTRGAVTPARDGLSHGGPRPGHDFRPRAAGRSGATIGHVRQIHPRPPPALRRPVHLGRRQHPVALLVAGAAVRRRGGRPARAAADALAGLGLVLRLRGQLRVAHARP